MVHIDDELGAEDQYVKVFVGTVYTPPEYATRTIGGLRRWLRKVADNLPDGDDQELDDFNLHNGS